MDPVTDDARLTVTDEMRARLLAVAYVTDLPTPAWLEATVGIVEAAGAGLRQRYLTGTRWKNDGEWTAVDLMLRSQIEALGEALEASRQ